MSQFPVSTQDGVYQSLNYLLSGPSNSGQSIRGSSSNVATALSENIVDQTTGQIVNSSPIVTNFLQPYLTDLQSRVGVTGGTDRVLLSAQLNNTYTYTTTADCTLQYTVFINRYRAQQNTNTTYDDFLFFFDKTVASQAYTSTLLTSQDGLVAVTATGTKIAYTQPASGSLVLPVDQTLTGVNATTGTGVDAVINVKIAYGTAGSYNNTNTEITVISPGANWSIGDTIVIPGASLGGATPANNLTLTVTGTSFGSGPSVTQETIFTNVVDEPGLGFYLYAVEVQWYALTGAIDIDTSSLGVRSLSAQVLKQ
jgi:hypothetical protein